MFVKKLYFYFSIEQLGKQKEKFRHKINYRDNLQFLNIKGDPSSLIVTRLMRDGKFLKLYKLLFNYYYYFILQNLRFLPYNNEFKNLFIQNLSFNDLNRVLYWRIFSVNCIFNLKKLKKNRLMYYLKPNRRVVLILNWIKFILKMKKKPFFNKTPALYEPLTNLLCVNKEQSEIFHLKLKIYRLRLMRG